MDLARTAALALALFVGAPGCGPSHVVSEQAGPHWSYSGTEGPSAWGDIAPEYALCKTGSAQSPIDIPTIVSKAELPPIAFQYEPLPLRVQNEGHTVRVFATKPASISVGPNDRDRYELVGLHFHSPSEHTIGGETFELEMHLVHKNKAGGVAVVAVLFKKGKEDAALAPILEHAPAKESEPRDVKGALVDLAALVPAGGAYVTYSGSLTTPPCTEGVTWFVLSSVAEASAAQIKKLRELLPEATNRPVQPIAGRGIFEHRP